MYFPFISFHIDIFIDFDVFVYIYIYIGDIGLYFPIIQYIPVIIETYH